MSSDADSSTHLVVLTPPGRGAIASISVQGPEATACVAACFSPANGRSFADAAIGRIVFGRWGRQAEGEELVVSRRSVENVEIHCHGGTAAVAAVVEDLTRAGCLQKTWQQSAETHHTSLIEAEAWQALVDARTQRTASILLDQFNGALADEIMAIRAPLLPQSDSNRDAFVQARQRCSALLETWPVGRHLTVPWKVVLSGATNVGKSSLINALVGFERAIVFDSPGTTRDALSASTAIDGFPVELIDTAGFRTAADAIETAGIERSRRELSEADLVVLVMDASQPVGDDESRLIETIPDALIVHNKTDLRSVDVSRRPSGLPISALTGSGVGDLLQAIQARLIPHPPEPHDAILFRPRHVDLLTRSREVLANNKPKQARSLLDCLLGRTDPRPSKT